MPGNKSVYNDALKKAHNYAWDGAWQKAVAEYRRALAEFPDDVNAHASLAHALEESGQLEGALHEARIAAKLSPHDPASLVRVAALQEKLGHAAEAAGAYIAVAEMHVAHKAMGKAVEAWQKAAALEPDRTDVHLKLAQVFEQGAHNALAAKEHLALARIYQRRGDKSKSLASAQKAQSIDPQSALAREIIATLERGGTIEERRADEKSAPAPSVPSPVGAAEKTALSRLADSILEERPAFFQVDAKKQTAPTLTEPEIKALIARAVDAQTHRRMGEAIEAYRKLLSAGVARAEVKFNLGLLYSESMRYDEAIPLLTETVDDSNLALASHFELGKCYRALGKADQAVEHFLQVTQIVDLASVQRDQADDLISVYQGLAETFVAKGDSEKAESFSRALEDFLSGRGWEDKVHQVRQHLQTLRQVDDQASLAELIEAGESAQVLEALALAQEYAKRNKTHAAREECMHAIELAPYYLPAHMRLAELLLKEGAIDAARAKFQVLAEVSAVRGDTQRAEHFMRQVIRTSPENVTDHSKLIDLLAKENRHDAALEELLELGNKYARAEQYAKAAEKYAEGLRLAARVGIVSNTVSHLRERLAETRVKQGDLKGALAAYQEIGKAAPDDERTRILIIDLEFRLEQNAAALRDLEELLARFRAQGTNQKTTSVLEGLAQSYSREPALHALLAQHYIAIGNKPKSIAELDALGELQLSLGQKEGAAATIRQIIALGPAQVEDYKQLLEQIGG